uniref:Peptide deformylase n=2 Tax=Araucaria cunninghamii TaxID=56994 RepID=A0A0D6R891_ARACU
MWMTHASARGVISIASGARACSVFHVDVPLSYLIPCQTLQLQHLRGSQIKAAAASSFSSSQGNVNVNGLSLSCSRAFSRVKRSAITAQAKGRRAIPFKQRQHQDDENFDLDLEYESPLEIIEYPDPRLRAKNKLINRFDEKLKQLVDEMFDLMYKTDGVGLSAPQVGINVQLMVFNPAGERGKGEEIVLVNPIIYKYSKKREVFTEGCLSFPEIYADVERPLTVKIEAQNITGKKFTLRLEEFPARIFQHEYDHLQGVLFFERMQPEILETIIPQLQALEQKYKIKTGMQTPERVNTNT